MPNNNKKKKPTGLLILKESIDITIFEIRMLVPEISDFKRIQTLQIYNITVLIADYD